jgi:hypothetical protein
VRVACWRSYRVFGTQEHHERRLLGASRQKYAVFPRKLLSAGAA